MTADDIAAHAQELLDANGFLTLGTVDPSGRP
jgi:predicted pyridoxine 5'-phosphate oxidase superfamily flavin-nucleotide-binding protein